MDRSKYVDEHCLLIDHHGGKMKRLVIVVAALLFVSGISAPAQATQGVAKKYASCADLLEKYPNGVAKNKKARKKAVKGGFAKPNVSKSLYKKNGSRLDRDKDGVMCEQEGKVVAPDPVAPPAVANLSIKPPNPDVSWSAETPTYSYLFQIPEAALPQVSQFQVTGTVNETIDMSTESPACRESVCTIYQFGKSAPWGSEVSLNVVTLGVNGLSSEPATTSVVFPGRPKQTNTWTFIANGSRTAVPNSSGGDDWADGNQTRTLELSRRLDKWALIGYSVYASNYSGTASCEILKNGVRVDYETSTGGSAYCSAG